MKSKIIFIVERDQEARVYFRKALEEKSHYVISTASATEALEMLKNMSGPHLVLLKPDPLDIEGADFIKFLRKIPWLKSVPICQIGSENVPSLEGSCCTAEKADFEKILKWLDTGVPEKFWLMP